MRNNVCKSYSVKKLLTERVKYVVPRYQRRYSWSNANVSQFINDLFFNIEVNGKDLYTNKYFIGIMILYINNSENTIKEYDIVDGQQRLTTIALVLSIIGKKLRELGYIEESNKTYHYLFFKIKGTEQKTIENKTSEQYLYDLTKTDSIVNDPDSEEEKTLKRAYNKIWKMLSESQLKERYEDIDYKDVLICLRNQILECYTFVIFADNALEANTYFETLNGKGVELLAVDLVKNRIFEVCGDKPNDTVKNTWNKMLKTLYGDSEHIGNLQTFYRHYWNSKYSKETEKTLFSKFKKMEKNAKEYEKFVLDMEKDAVRYMKIVYPKTIDYKKKNRDRLIQSLDSIDDFGVIIHRVPIMSLFKAYDDKKIKFDKIIQITEFLELFHFVYNALLKKANNTIEKYYSTYAINVRNSKNSNEILKHTNELFDLLISKLPDKTEFIDCFVKLEYVKNKRSLKYVRTRYAIRKLSCIFDKRDTYANDGSIEHVVNESVGGKAINVGNLLFLEEIRNNSIPKDATYKEKIEEYKKSEYKWVKGFINKYSDFNVDMIDERSSFLANAFYDYAEKVFNMKLL